MRFKFEPGHYAFVGPETYEGRQVLRVEYYRRRPCMTTTGRGT